MALTGALIDAERDADAALRKVWPGGGASAYREQLATDIALAYAAARDGMILAVSQAFHAIPSVPFVPGVTPPGTNPQIEAANLRAIAARRAAQDFAAKLALRNTLTIATAGKGGETAAVLAEAQTRYDSGEDVWLEWRASQDGHDPRSCGWCKTLHGQRARPGEQFPHPKPIGKRKPPKLYLGTLYGPPLHPRCRCKIVIVTGHTVAEPPAPVPVPEQGDFISSDVIKAMPEEEYSAMHHFLRSALHELGQVLYRLVHPRG